MKAMMSSSCLSAPPKHLGEELALRAVLDFGDQQRQAEYVVNQVVHLIGVLLRERGVGPEQCKKCLSRL
jgi:hypothetical protein